MAPTSLIFSTSMTELSMYQIIVLTILKMGVGAN